jgi:hypothetical protein
MEHLTDAERRELNELDAALARIACGSYGRCVSSQTCFAVGSLHGRSNIARRRWDHPQGWNPDARSFLLRFAGR